MACGGSERLVIPAGRFWQELKLVEKKKGKMITKDIVPVRFVPMLRKRPEDKWSEDKELAEGLRLNCSVKGYSVEIED